MLRIKLLVRELLQKTSTENGVLNFWTLRFVDPQLESLFKVEGEKELRRKRIEVCILSILLLVSAAYLAFTGPKTMGILKITFHAFMFVWTLCGNVMLHFPMWQRRCHEVFAIFGAGCALFLIIEIMIVIDSPVIGRDYQSGFASLVIFMIFSIIRVTYFLAILSAVSIWVAQVVVAIIVGSGHGFTWYKIIGFTFGIASAIIISGCAGYFMELKHRSVLLHKQILSEESERLQASCNRFDKLLLNIFPKKIASTLKKAQPKFIQGFSTQQLLVLDRWGSGQAVLNHQYPCVSVLLVDIVGFTPLSSVVAPRAMVSILNNIFSCFDDILEEHSLEKIRTIGDAYLCVGNMTKSLENHQEMAIRAGWQMLHNIKMLPPIKGIKINLRIGISCGPISAGVVGTTKWNYDIFGPTYSEAIAAEGVSIPGHVTVTGAVYNDLEKSDEFTFEPAESGGVVRYTVMSSQASALPPKQEDESELECPSFTPRTRLSPLRILLPSDFNWEEGESIEITISESSSSCTASALSTPSWITGGSPIINPSPLSLGSPPTSPRHSSQPPTSPTSPTHSAQPPPFLSLSMSGGETKRPGSVLSVSRLRDRCNDFELRDLDMIQNRDSMSMSNENFEKLRASHFFKELMRKHGVSNFVHHEYSMGAKRHNAERELLENQEERIKRGVLYMRFTSTILEEEFWNHFLRNAQKHLSTTSFCLTAAICLWISGDLLSSPLGPSGIPHFVFFNFGAAAITSCLFGFYIQSEWYHHWSSKWISMFVMFVVGTLVSLVVYFDHVTIFHFYHLYFFLCTCFLYTRVWVVHAMVPVSVMSAVAVCFCFLYVPARNENVYRRNVMAAFACCIIMSIVNFIAYAGLEKSLRTEFIMSKLIQNEFELHQTANEATKMLVRNILPSEIATRLCAGHKVSIVDHISAATIMFIGIPNLYSSAKPGDVFYLLNDIYTIFDEITLTFGLEKIKAVNSTYMVASGVPKPRSDHMIQAITLAKMIIRKMTRDFRSPHLDKLLDIRVGIASGDVVAAIVGKRKYTYDCWSDCVNTAARMESHGVVGKIQVTENVYTALNHKLNFQDRGEIFVKGKGMMRTYLLDPYE